MLPSFAKDAMKVDASTFQDTYHNSVERKLTGFEQEGLKEGLEVQAYVDVALHANKWNGHSSVGFVVMVGNTLVIPKARTQTSAEKSTYVVSLQLIRMLLERTWV